MAILLALSSAVTYGAADFAGGLAARRLPSYQVALLSQMVGLVLIVSLLAVLSGDLVAEDQAWGALAGATTTLALTAFYRAMADGPMSVVAPVSALMAAIVPVAVGLISGESLGPVVLVGVALAFVAIAVVSQPGPDSVERAMLARRSTIAMAVAAGSLFGTIGVFYEQMSPDAGAWPLVTSRLVSVPLLAMIVVATRTPVRPQPGSGRLLVVTGAFDMLANVFLLLALARGLLSVVGTVGALYPASTLILARTVLHERLSAAQKVGLALAVGAVLLVSVG